MSSRSSHVLESITGHLTRRMLEHYSHIRIDAKRQALDALDELRKKEAPDKDAPSADTSDDDDRDVQADIEVEEALTSQSRHSLTLSGDPPHGKLLIPFSRRDVRVVEGARLEIALTVSDGVLQISITVAKPTTEPRSRLLHRSP